MPPNSFAEWVIGQNLPKRANSRVVRAQVELSADEETDTETLTVTIPRNSRNTENASRPRSSSIKKVRFGPATPGTSSPRRSNSTFGGPSEDVAVYYKPVGHARRKSVQQESSDSESDSEAEPSLKVVIDGVRMDLHPDPKCTCKDCTEGRKYILKMAAKCKDSENGKHKNSEAGKGRQGKQGKQGKKKETQCDSDTTLAADSTGAESESASGSDSDPTPPKKAKQQQNNKSQQGQKNQKGKDKNKPNKDGQPKTDGGNSKKVEKAEKAQDSKNSQSGKGKQDTQAPKSLKEPQNRYTPFPPTEIREPNLIMPVRAQVLQIEHTVEDPTLDPRPNAFVDSQQGICRMYHGPYWGNPFASLYPRPHTSQPMAAPGSYHPLNAPYNWGVMPENQPAYGNMHHVHPGHTPHSIQHHGPVYGFPPPAHGYPSKPPTPWQQPSSPQFQQQWGSGDNRTPQQSGPPVGLSGLPAGTFMSGANPQAQNGSGSKRGKGSRKNGAGNDKRGNKGNEGGDTWASGAQNDKPASNDGADGDWGGDNNGDGGWGANDNQEEKPASNKESGDWNDGNKSDKPPSNSGGDGWASNSQNGKPPSNNGEAWGNDNQTGKPSSNRGGNTDWGAGSNQNGKPSSIRGENTDWGAGSQTGKPSSNNRRNKSWDTGNQNNGGGTSWAAGSQNGRQASSEWNKPGNSQGSRRGSVGNHSAKPKSPADVWVTPKPSWNPIRGSDWAEPAPVANNGNQHSSKMPGSWSAAPTPASQNSNPASYRGQGWNDGNGYGSVPDWADPTAAQNTAGPAEKW